MKLDYAFLAENAGLLQDEGKFCIFGGGLDTFNVSGLPAVVTFWLFARIEAEDGEKLDGHTVAMELVNPAGERVKMGETSDLALSEAAPHVRSNASMLMKLIIKFLTEGIYTLHLSLDGNEAKVLPLSVVKREKKDD